MSESKDKFYALGTIVDDWLDDNNLHNGFWQKGLKWAQRAVRKIRLDVFQHPKTVLLAVTERKTVVVPGDYIDWTKIGVRRGQYVITLAVNDEMAINERSVNDNTVRGLLSQHMPNGLDFSQYGGYTFFNYNGSSLNGFGGGLPSKGYVKFVDHGDCKEILLDYDYGYQDVYLEYITDGLDACKETIIHPYEYDYVMAYMEMMYEKKNNPKATNFTKNETERDVFFADRELRARYNDLTPKDVLTMSRAQTRFTAKI